MKLSRDSDSFWFSDGEGNGWNTTTWATPFSGFEGRAIYMDSDVIVLADIAQLWHQPMQPGKVALAKGGGSWRYCVSLWDCAEAVKHLPALPWLKREASSHQKMVAYFKDNPGLTQAFSGDWNCLDGEGHPNLRDGAVKAIHYTDMGTQPQLRHAAPRQGRTEALV
jgi:hypothetical protein